MPVAADRVARPQPQVQRRTDHLSPSPSPAVVARPALTHSGLTTAPEEGLPVVQLTAEELPVEEVPVEIEPPTEPEAEITTEGTPADVADLPVDRPLAAAPASVTPTALDEPRADPTLTLATSADHVAERTTPEPPSGHMGELGSPDREQSAVASPTTEDPTVPTWSASPVSVPPVAPASPATTSVQRATLPVAHPSPSPDPGGAVSTPSVMTRAEPETTIMINEPEPSGHGGRTRSEDLSGTTGLVEPSDPTSIPPVRLPVQRALESTAPHDEPVHPSPTPMEDERPPIEDLQEAPVIDLEEPVSDPMGKPALAGLDTSGPSQPRLGLGEPLPSVPMTSRPERAEETGQALRAPDREAGPSAVLRPGPGSSNPAPAALSLLAVQRHDATAPPVPSASASALAPRSRVGTSRSRLTGRRCRSQEGRPRPRTRPETIQTGRQRSSLRGDQPRT